MKQKVLFFAILAAMSASLQAHEKVEIVDLQDAAFAPAITLTYEVAPLVSDFVMYAPTLANCQTPTSSNGFEASQHLDDVTALQVLKLRCSCQGNDNDRLSNQREPKTQVIDDDLGGLRYSYQGNDKNSKLLRYSKPKVIEDDVSGFRTSIIDDNVTGFRS